MKAPKDYNALAFDPDRPVDPRSKHFIPREGSRNKALEIKFDPLAHREWVTGFRKRKNERKTAAIKGLEERAKRERQEERTERIKQKKQRLHLPDNYGVEDSDTEEATGMVQKVTGQTKYNVGGFTTTVTTAALDYSGSEGEDDEDDDDDDHTQGNGSRPPSANSLFPSGGDIGEDDADEGSDSPGGDAMREQPAGKSAHAKGKKGGGLTGYAKASNQLAKLKERKSGKVRKIPGQGKNKNKHKNKAKAKQAKRR